VKQLQTTSNPIPTSDTKELLFYASNQISDLNDGTSLVDQILD
jgi:hypothetical protein